MGDRIIIESKEIGTMKNKLYYTDAYIKNFEAQVVKQEQDEAGEWYVTLSQTAFYPTGGGQPYDIGKLNNRNVIKVEEIDEEIRHYINEPLEDTEKDVTGIIDWERRFDHMQQHSGQHILSAAFDNLFNFRTVSFHLGNETLTIDINTETLSEEEARKAEDLANQIILENRPIQTKWVTEDELSEYTLRKETKVKEDIRLVIIPDFDYNGCGGTHPGSTGEVQSIKILDWEKQKKNIRVQFVCGQRVLKQLGQKQKVLLGLTKLLNSPEQAMEQAVNRLLEQGKAVEKELEKARELLLQYEAKDMLAETNEEHVIRKIFQDRTIQELQKLAKYITLVDEKKLVYFVSKNDNKLQLVCARGAARSESMKSAMGKALPLINGKGGGNDAFAQGGGDALVTEEQILKHLTNI
jgi:alanyl-tRNA synthetase